MAHFHDGVPMEWLILCLPLFLKQLLDERVGELLAKQLITDAKEIGYTLMRLDTLNTLTSAVTLYRKLGFVQTDPYYHNPYEGVVYLELLLK